MPPADHEQVLECGVCYERYSEDNKPIKLRVCDHRFCRICVQGLLQFQLLNCPFCRMAFLETDVSPDRNTWSLINMLLSALSNNRRRQGTQTLEEFKEVYEPLKPTLKNLILLENAIIACYEKTIAEAESTQTYNWISIALKSLSTAACFFPPTAIAGLISNGVLTAADLTYDIVSGSSKKGAYAKLSEVVIKHDKLSGSPQILALFSDYQELMNNRDQAPTYGGHLGVNEPYLAETEAISRLDLSIQGFETLQLGASVYMRGQQALEAAKTEGELVNVIEGGQNLLESAEKKTGIVETIRQGVEKGMNSVKEGAKKGLHTMKEGAKSTSKTGLSVTTKGLLVGGLVVQWVVVFYQWKKEENQIEYLKARIAETRSSIELFERVVALMEGQN